MDKLREEFEKQISYLMMKSWNGSQSETAMPFTECIWLGGDIVPVGKIW